MCWSGSPQPTRRRAACEAAARGENVETAVSDPHVAARGMMQNATMAAPRRGGLAFGRYELHGALRIALTQPTALDDWLAGADPLAAAVAAGDGHHHRSRVVMYDAIIARWRTPIAGVNMKISAVIVANLQQPRLILCFCISLPNISPCERS